MSDSTKDSLILLLGTIGLVVATLAAEGIL